MINLVLEVSFWVILLAYIFIKLSKYMRDYKLQY